MKVLFDHQIFCYQKHGGISRYFKELMKELSKNDTVFNPIGWPSNNHPSPLMDRKSKLTELVNNNLLIRYYKRKGLKH